MDSSSNSIYTKQQCAVGGGLLQLSHILGYKGFFTIVLGGAHNSGVKIRGWRICLGRSRPHFDIFLAIVALTRLSPYLLPRITISGMTSPFRPVPNHFGAARFLLRCSLIAFARLWNADVKHVKGREEEEGELWRAGMCAGCNICETVPTSISGGEGWVQWPWFCEAVKPLLTKKRERKVKRGLTQLGHLVFLWCEAGGTFSGHFTINAFVLHALAVFLSRFWILPKLTPLTESTIQI